MRKMHCELISLRRVYDLSFRLASQIRESGYKPDFIVAIARGGFVPARFLCDFLHVKDMTAIGVQHYAPGARKMRKAKVKFPLSADVSGRRVLIVDDVNDTGESLLAALNHLRSFRPAQLKTAVLHQKETTVCGANFVAFHVRAWRWILYPWAVVEDVGSFIAQMKPQSKNLATAAARLRKEHSIQIPVKLLEKIMALQSPIENR
jgi:hypothetical protein